MDTLVTQRERTAGGEAQELTAALVPAHLVSGQGLAQIHNFYPPREELVQFLINSW